MKAQRKISGLLLLAAVLLSAGACKKESATPAENTKTNQLASDNARAESLFDDIKRWSDQAMAAHAKRSTLADTVFMGTCVLATLDLSQTPYLLRIDFGPSNCLCTDGVYRRGKILVTFNGSYGSPGTVINYAFDNYFVNDHQLLGTKSVTNMGVNNEGQPWWQVVVAGQVVKPNNGGTITWNSTCQYAWSVGYNTLWEWWDDVYLITGTVNGIAADGKHYTCTVVNPLVKKMNCQWISGGTLDIQPEGMSVVQLDYGSGSCDNILRVTYNGQTYTVQMI